MRAPALPRNLRAAYEAAVAGPLAAVLRDRMAAAFAGAEGGMAGAAAGDSWDLAVAPDEPGTLLLRYPAAR